jgi:cation transport ATPase
MKQQLKTDMKKTILTLIALVATGIGAFAQQETSSTKDGMETLQIKTSAVCEMCKETLEKTMAYEKGVKSSALDVDSKVLTVTYNPKKTSPEKIKLAITKVGYDADDLHADAKAYENLDICCKKDAKH